MASCPRSFAISVNDLPTSDASGHARTSDSRRSRWKNFGRVPIDPLPTEARAILGVVQERGALGLLGEVERRSAGAELLEDHEIEPVRPEVEQLGEGLPAKVGVEARVEDASHGLT